ncbi:MAG TPA: two-component system response regulator OmpR [Steroidobacteraceae bacterium]|nr:two-component system response regulator OmpR [Steroidobacteraceae bacterium]
MDKNVNPERSRVLVLDDEPELRSLLQRYLTEQGFEVRALADAPQLERLIQREHFDVLVLDINLPGEDGLSICRRLRAQGETIPIIMLTARGDPIDRILGREMGADDYLPKPFNPRELTACIRALLRRQQLLGAHAKADAGRIVRFGEFTFHIDARRLMKGEQAVELTSGEIGLLTALVNHAGRPLGRDRLIDLVRGREHEATDRSIDVQILRLRRVIERDPSEPRYLQTVRGIGYVFVADCGES